MRELSRKRQRFVSEYLKDQNGTKAAIRAGYSKKTAGQIANEYLKIPQIKYEIEQRLNEIAKKADITAESVLRRLNLVADRCIQEIDPIFKANGIYKRDRNTGKICFDFDSSGATRALELLGKTMGMFIDKHDVIVGGSKLVFVHPTEEKNER